MVWWWVCGIPTRQSATSLVLSLPEHLLNVTGHCLSSYLASSLSSWHCQCCCSLCHVCFLRWVFLLLVIIGLWCSKHATSLNLYGHCWYLFSVDFAILIWLSICCCVYKVIWQLQVYARWKLTYFPLKWQNNCFTALIPWKPCKQVLSPSSVQLACINCDRFTADWQCSISFYIQQLCYKGANSMVAVGKSAPVAFMLLGNYAKYSFCQHLHVSKQAAKISEIFVFSLTVNVCLNCKCSAPDTSRQWFLCAVKHNSITVIS